jgi:hypothetical protein
VTIVVPLAARGPYGWPGGGKPRDASSSTRIQSQPRPDDGGVKNWTALPTPVWAL